MAKEKEKKRKQYIYGLHSLFPTCLIIELYIRNKGLSPNYCSKFQSRFFLKKEISGRMMGKKYIILMMVLVILFLPEVQYKALAFTLFHPSSLPIPLPCPFKLDIVTTRNEGYSRVYKHSLYYVTTTPTGLQPCFLNHFLFFCSYSLRFFVVCGKTISCLH